MPMPRRRRSGRAGGGGRTERSRGARAQRRRKARGVDDAAVRRLCETICVDALSSPASARMPARVFAALLTTDSGSLTAAGLAAMLHVSPAAISGAVPVSDPAQPGQPGARTRVTAGPLPRSTTRSGRSREPARPDAGARGIPALQRRTRGARQRLARGRGSGSPRPSILRVHPGPSCRAGARAKDRGRT